jgi:uncharacterized protein YbaA (DUF1428 family)
MANYVDAFVVAVPKSKLDDYKKVARTACKLFLEYGAVDYQELVADDVPYGKTTSFPRAVDRKNSETVIFAWITYKSRAQRDKVNKSIMKDPKFLALMEPNQAIFDSSRMIYGGFKSLVSA